jgi:hypothetical protein
MTVRNRIKAHRRVRAGDLVPHEFNYRYHPDNQKRTLQALYDEIGFARSLLAYELPDGRLKLIDGHLRRSLDPNMEVDVEILDVTDEEARTLLLSIDPLAQLALNQEQLQMRLMDMTPTSSAELRELWQRTAEDTLTAIPEPPRREVKYDGVMRYYVLIACRGDFHQRELLQRFRAEGLDCEPKLG